MMRELYYYIAIFAAMIGLVVYMGTESEPKYCADHGLGITTGEKCLTFGSDKE